MPERPPDFPRLPEEYEDSASQPSHESPDKSESRVGPEFGTTFPELIAQQPLENTTLVYSVPVMGEWHNGNLLRMLHSMFSQRVGSEAFEVELVANCGRDLEDLVPRDPDTNAIVRDERGRIVLLDSPMTGSGKRAKELLAESEQSLAYLRLVIRLQGLARPAQPSGHEKEQIAEVLDGLTDRLQREVARLAVERANTISLAVVDASHTVFSLSAYQVVTSSSLRTLGADVARVRFENNPDLVVNMFDADTVLADNQTAAQIQAIFADPAITYAFSGMSNFVAGTSPDFFADAPRENVQRTTNYNRDPKHGSPQIAFRLRAYDKLRELAGWSRYGFVNFVDFDTAVRLIYHFGALQDGLLFEQAAVYPPTSLTADRIDGTSDSVGRKGRFEAFGVQSIERNLFGAFTFRQQVRQLVEHLRQEEKELVERELALARQHYQRQQELQQRFNRVVLRSLMTALTDGAVGSTEMGLAIDEEAVIKLPAGKALLHYVRNQGAMVNQAARQLGNIEAVRYYLGDASAPADFWPTQFQGAVREYVGDVRALDQLLADGVVEAFPSTGEVEAGRWEGKDNRELASKISLMHSVVAEVLALAHVYRKYFETREFLASHGTAVKDPNMKDMKELWPDNPNQQLLPYHFGEQDERLRRIREHMMTEWESLALLPVPPISELFRRLRRTAASDPESKVDEPDQGLVE